MRTRPGSSVRRLTTEDGVALRMGFRPGAGRGIVLLFQGRTEFLEKYAEVADAIVDVDGLDAAQAIERARTEVLRLRARH